MFATEIDYDTEQIERAVATVQSRFPDDIERVVWSLREDWAGEPALYIRVLIKDKPDTPQDWRPSPQWDAAVALCLKIKADFVNEVRGVHLWPYVHFRRVSEQQRLRDPAWD